MHFHFWHNVKKKFPNYWLSLQHYLLHIFAIKKMFITLLFLRDIVVRNEPAKSNFCLNRNHCSGRKINLTKFSKIKWCFNFTIFLKKCFAGPIFVTNINSNSITSIMLLILGVPEVPRNLHFRQTSMVTTTTEAP